MNFTLEATVGERGQVVIPKPIREAYDLRAGATVRVGLEGEHIVISHPGEPLAEFLAEAREEPEPTGSHWNAAYFEEYWER